MGLFMENDQIEGQDIRSWYAVQLKPDGFDTARRNLDRQGYIPFMPMRPPVSGPKGRARQHKPAPLFPGYLFVHVPEKQQNWRAINSTLGVSRLVMSRPDRPAILPRGFVESLQARCDMDGLYRTAENLKPGDSVAMVSGPFAGVIAQIDSLSRSGRIGVLLEILGRSVRSQVPTDYLDVVPIATKRAS